MSEHGICVDCRVLLHPSSAWYWWPETDSPESAVVYPLCQICADYRYGDCEASA